MNNPTYTYDRLKCEICPFNGQLCESELNERTVSLFDLILVCGRN